MKWNEWKYLHMIFWKIFCKLKSWIYRGPMLKRKLCFKKHFWICICDMKKYELHEKIWVPYPHEITLLSYERQGVAKEVNLSLVAPNHDKEFWFTTIPRASYLNLHLKLLPAGQSIFVRGLREKTSPPKFMRLRKIKVFCF